MQVDALYVCMCMTQFQHVKPYTKTTRALADYASIILGKIGASEHQELCWKNR